MDVVWREDRMSLLKIWDDCIIHSIMVSVNSQRAESGSEQEENQVVWGLVPRLSFHLFGLLLE